MSAGLAKTEVHGAVFVFPAGSTAAFEIDKVDYQ
jgi:hypothetical protein